MRRYYCILISFFLMASLNAQSRAGITGVRDTSYSIMNEYNKHLKNYPFIQIAKAAEYHYVTVESNISYCNTKERELKLDVYSPVSADKSKRTAIIFIFGGGWRSGNKSMHTDLLKELAALGYV